MLKTKTTEKLMAYFVRRAYNLISTGLSIAFIIITYILSAVIVSGSCVAVVNKSSDVN